MVNSRDLYEVLGLAKGADSAGIKKAYRHLARKHHPDVDKSPGAEERFKEINEAYQILSDPKKKAAYDQYGAAAFSQGGPGGPGGPPAGGGGAAGRWGPFSYTYTTTPGAGQVDPFDIFEQVFGFRGFGRQRRGRNAHYSLAISFSQAVTGLEKELDLEGKKLKIRIPAGADDGLRLRFAGEGEAGPSGTPPGDLYLTVRVEPSREFVRQGDDLYSLAEITYLQAILGDTAEVPSLDPGSGGVKPIKLKIPSGTQPGTEFRLRGKGMPRIHRKGRGDHYIRVRVKIPEKLSKKERDLLLTLRKS